MHCNGMLEARARTLGLRLIPPNEQEGGRGRQGGHTVPLAHWHSVPLAQLSQISTLCGPDIAR